MHETDANADQDETIDADPIGPGTGGTPLGGGPADPAARAEAAGDPEVAAMVRALREDMREDPADIRADVAEASEQMGTGTDR